MAARLTNRNRALRLITERQYQTTIEQLLKATGWRYFHSPPNRPANGFVARMVRGWPDLFAIRGDRAIAVELKTETGKTTPDQDAWLTELGSAGIETYIWRPRDIDDARRILAHIDPP